MFPLRHGKLSPRSKVLPRISVIVSQQNNCFPCTAGMISRSCEAFPCTAGTLSRPCESFSPIAGKLSRQNKGLPRDCGRVSKNDFPKGYTPASRGKSISCYPSVPHNRFKKKCCLRAAFNILFWHLNSPFFRHLFESLLKLRLLNGFLFISMQLRANLFIIN